MFLKLILTNQSESDCPKILFLEIEIDQIPKYKSYLENYFQLTRKQ